MRTLNGEMALLFSEEERETLYSQRNSVNFDRLVLELTRRCNMRCRHCLRGEAEDMDMPKKTVIKALNMADQINEVTLTGGEPTLAIEMIRYIYEVLLDKYGKGNLPPFFIATNGLVHQLELASVLMQWYDNSYEQDLCCVELSRDIFHADCDEPDANYLQYLTFFGTDKQHSLHESEEKAAWLLAEGRAANLPKNPNTIRNHVNYDAPLQVEEYNGSIYIGEYCYVSADELVIATCDCSYESVRRHHQCSLDDLPTLKAG